MVDLKVWLSDEQKCQLRRKERSNIILVISYTTIATDESRMYEGIRDLNRSCETDQEVGDDEMYAQRAHLPSGVPELQPHCPVIEIQGFAEEVYPDSCLVRVVKRVIHKPGSVRPQNLRSHIQA